MTTVRPILIPFVTLADLLVATFGNDCEVIVHDLTIPERSVVYVANGVVTCRQIGDSFEHLITEMLQRNQASKDILANYFFTHEGKVIRSSSLIIRDEKHKIQGALCINIDTTRDSATLSMLKQITAQLETRLHPVQKRDLTAEQTDADRSVESFVFDFIDKVIGPERTVDMTRPKRLALVAYLDKKGVFLLKGALEYVASKLGLARVTLYSDLDTVRKTMK